jgi:peptidoglycan/LPS O-acetylase OafA/YrhL
MAMADTRFTESVERHRVLALVLGLAGVVLTVAFWIPAHAAPDPSLPRAGHALLQMASAWVAVLACLGFGKRYLDRTSPALAYASEASYPFYILHQTVIVALGFYLVKLGWPALPTWLLLMASAVVMTLALYEGVRRTGPTRFLFGMKRAA